MNHFISSITKTMDEILNKVTKLLDLYKKIKNKIKSTNYLSKDFKFKSGLTKLNCTFKAGKARDYEVAGDISEGVTIKKGVDP